MNRITKEDFNEFSNSILALTTIASGSNIHSIDMLDSMGEKYVNLTKEEAIEEAERFSNLLYGILSEEGVVDY